MNTPAQNLKFMNRTVQLDKIVKPSSNCGTKLRILYIVTAVVCEQRAGYVTTPLLWKMQYML